MESKMNIPIEEKKLVSIPELGKVIQTSKEGVYAVKEQAIVEKEYVVTCPICGKPVLVKAVEPITFRVMHKTCNVPIIIKGVNPKKPTDKFVVMGSKSNAKLTWWSLTGRKQFILRVGKNYVGRKDDDNPSDLSLKDEYASAKSIYIDVDKTSRGYTFHLTVEHATNPVLINGKEQPVGSSFYLNDGDIIKLGNTTLTFKPAKK